MTTTEAAPHGRTRPADVRGPRCDGCGAATDGATCARCGTPAGERPDKPGVPALLRGVNAPFRGLGYLTTHPSLWLWVIIPLILNSVLFGTVLAWTINNLADYMPSFDEPWWPWMEWARVSLGILLEAMLYAAGFIAAFLTTLLLAGVINSPFYDFLSEKTEVLWFEAKDPGRGLRALPMDIMRSIRAAASVALRQFLVLLVLFPLSFTAIGAPLFAIAGMYYAGYAQYDVTLARKLYPGGRRTRWARRHWGLMIGAGLPLTFVPLLAPFGIVGTTLGFLEEQDKQ